MQQETFTPPLNGDVDQGWALLAVCWTFIACALITTILRVWVRARITHNVGGDDYVAVAAMVRARAHCIERYSSPWRIISTILTMNRQRR